MIKTRTTLSMHLYTLTQVEIHVPFSSPSILSAKEQLLAYCQLLGTERASLVWRQARKDGRDHPLPPVRALKQ